MHCSDVRAQLQAYVDGELPPERAALVSYHLAGCQECQAELVRLQEIVAALPSWPTVDEPTRLTAHIMIQVRTQSQLPRFRIHWTDLALSGIGTLTAFAAMLGWRYLPSPPWAYLRDAQAYFCQEMLPLTKLPVASLGVAWGLSLIGLSLVMILSLVAVEEELFST